MSSPDINDSRSRNDVKVSLMSQSCACSVVWRMLLRIWTCYSSLLPRALSPLTLHLSHLSRCSTRPPCYMNRRSAEPDPCHTVAGIPPCDPAVRTGGVTDQHRQARRQQGAVLGVREGCSCNVCSSWKLCRPPGSWRCVRRPSV